MPISCSISPSLMNKPPRYLHSITWGSGSFIIVAELWNYKIPWCTGIQEDLSPISLHCERCRCKTVNNPTPLPLVKLLTLISGFDSFGSMDLPTSHPAVLPFPAAVTGGTALPKVTGSDSSHTNTERGGGGSMGATNPCLSCHFLIIKLTKQSGMCVHIQTHTHRVNPRQFRSGRTLRRHLTIYIHFNYAPYLLLFYSFSFVFLGTISALLSFLSLYLPFFCLCVPAAHCPPPSPSISVSTEAL